MDISVVGFYEDIRDTSLDILTKNIGKTNSKLYKIDVSYFLKALQKQN